MDNETKQNSTFFRFEDLRVYHKSLDYTDWVINATKQFPEDNSRTLANRFIHSAQSIAFYIAEGSARNKTQFVHFLKMAKSAVRECVVLTTIIEKQNLLSDMKIDESRNELMEMTKMLGALIGSLQRSQGKVRGKGKGSYQDSEQDDGFDYNYNSDEEFIPASSIDIKKY